MGAAEPRAEQLAEQIRAAAGARTPLVIRAGGTKDFYGNACAGERLDPRVLTGIVEYEPTELVVTVRWLRALVYQGVTSPGARS